MPRVVIRGTTPDDIVIEIDGQRPTHVRAFRLLANNPNGQPILQIDMDATAIDVDVEAAVVPPIGASNRETIAHMQLRMQELERQLAAFRNEPVPTPRRRHRSNLRWRQRYNELFEEVAENSDEGSQQWEHLTRNQIRLEMAGGSDPDPGRTFPVEPVSPGVSSYSPPSDANDSSGVSGSGTANPARPFAASDTVDIDQYTRALARIRDPEIVAHPDTIARLAGSAFAAHIRQPTLPQIYVTSFTRRLERHHPLSPTDVTVEASGVLTPDVASVIRQEHAILVATDRVMAVSILSYDVNSFAQRFMLHCHVMQEMMMDDARRLLPSMRESSFAPEDQVIQVEQNILNILREQYRLNAEHSRNPD